MMAYDRVALSNQTMRMILNLIFTYTHIYMYMLSWVHEMRYGHF